MGVDAFYSLYTGQIVAKTGPPHQELLTTAASRAWVDQQWLGQWLYFEIYHLGGYSAVALSSLLLVTAAGVLLARLIEHRDGHMSTAWASAAVTVTVLSTAAVRTQTMVFPLFVALLWILTSMIRRSEPHPSALLVLPILVLWANLHGSVLLGAALAAGCMLWLASRSLRKGNLRHAAAATGLAGAALASVFASPYGVSVVDYYSSLMGNSTLRTYVADWQPSSVTQVSAWPFVALCAFCALSLIAGLRMRRHMLWQVEVALTVVLVALGFYSSRYVVWAAIVMAYAASVHGTRPTIRLPARLATSSRLIAASLLVVAAIALFTTPSSHFTSALPDKVADAATAGLAAAPDSVVLTDQTTSTALLWLHPGTHRRVAFDIRYEQYRTDDLANYFGFLKAEDPAFACQYDMLAVSTDERPKLVAAIRDDPAWTPTYDGKEGIVAVRTPGTACP